MQALEASDCPTERERDYDDETQEEAMSSFYATFNELLDSAQWDNESLIAIMKLHIHEWAECKLCTLLDAEWNVLFERLFDRFEESLSLGVLRYMFENLNSSHEVEWSDTSNDRILFNLSIHPLATKQMLEGSAWHWAQVEQWSVSEDLPSSRETYLAVVESISLHPSSSYEVVRDWLKAVHEELPNSEHLGCNYGPSESCANCSEILGHCSTR